MILPPYSSYQNSGVSWLGDVPKHWMVVRLKNICSKSGIYGANINTSHYQKTGIRFLRITDITDSGQIKDKGVFVPQDIVLDYVLQDNDILLSRSGTIGRSFLYQSKVHGPCAYAGYLVRFVPNSMVLPKWIFLFTKTLAFDGFLRIMAISSTIENVNADKYTNAFIPLPPLDEQTAIVKFLDWKEARIQRHLRTKQKLIALLEELKTATIQQAVTRGLNPHAPLKSSGVQWLGDVPKHWAVRRLRTVVDMRVSNVDKHSKDGEIPIELCNYVDVYKNTCIDKTINFMRATATEAEINRFRLAVGDVLITKDSETWDDIGVPALVSEAKKNLICGYHLALLRPLHGVVAGGYLFYALLSKSVAHQFHIRANGVTRYGLSNGGIKSISLPLPPIPEQTAIVEHLDKATAQIDAVIAKVRREMELLREYRVRLISDVVTGKIDVQKAAAKLPAVENSDY